MADMNPMDDQEIFGLVTSILLRLSEMRARYTLDEMAVGLLCVAACSAQATGTPFLTWLSRGEEAWEWAQVAMCPGEEEVEEGA